MRPTALLALVLCVAAFAAASTNVWTLLSDYPPGLTTKSGIEYNNKLYLFPEGNVNDWDAEQRTMNHLYVMNDLATHSWEFRTTVGLAPIVRDDYCSVRVRDKVAIFGGLTDTFLADVSFLSLTNLAWTPYERDVRNSPKGRRFPYCFEWDDSLFVYGGLGPISSYNDLWQFNSTNGEWIRIPTTDAPFTYGGVSAVYNNQLFVYSGRTTTNVPNTLWRMNLTNYVWNSVSISPLNKETLTGAYRASSAFVGSRLYVFFGLSNVESTTPLTTYFALDLDLNAAGASQTVFYGTTPNPVAASYPYGQTHPLPRYGSSAVAIGSKIVLSGGIHNNVEDTVWVFDAVNNVWSDVSSNRYPISRRGASTISISSAEFLAFGGYVQPKSSKVLLNDLWSFNRNTRVWTNLSPLTAYSMATLDARPPGLRRSSMAFYNGNVYILGGYSDLDENPDIFYSFNIASKSWTRLDLNGTANGVAKSYGQAYANIQSLFYVWGGKYLGAVANITRQSITTINLNNLAVKTFSGSGSAPSISFAANGFVFGGQTFCVQGGASNDYDTSPAVTFDSSINCFRDSSNSWFAFSSPPRTAPTLSFSSFAFVGSGIMTGGVNSFGDNTYETWIYDFIRKTWGKHADPVDRPGPFSHHSSAALGSYVVVAFADSGSTLDNRVYSYNTGTMFCSGNQEIIASGSSITVDDGSAGYTYMPNTNCSWTVQGANNLVVTQFSLDPSASLKMRVETECGDRSIKISNRDTVIQEASLSGLPLSTTVNVPSGSFKMFFESSSTYDTLGGFTFSGLNCPKGFRVQSSRCVCPLNHYITPSNECYPCEAGTYQTATNMRHCLVTGSRIVAATNYFVNASIGDWLYVNETMPLCLSSSAATFKGVAYFFCSFNGAAARESDTVPLTVFTITQLYTSKWKYEVPATTVVPPSRKSACTLSTSSAVYYVSGRSPAVTDRHAYSYDPVTRTWTRLAPSPIDVAGQACIISGDNIIVHGGETAQGEVISSMQIYSIANDVWTIETWANSPALSYHSAWFYSGRMFIFGGYDGIQEMNGVYSANIATKMWNGPNALRVSECVDCFKDGRSCVLARQMMSTSIVGNKVYLYGGYQRKTVFRELLVLDTVNEIPTITTFLPFDPEDYSLQSAPPATFQASSAVMGSNLFIFGGYGSQSGSPLNFMWNFNTVEEVWFGSNQAYNPLPRRDFAATKILEFGFAIFGGYVRSFTEYLTNDAWIFNKRISQWVRLTSHELVPSKPAPRSRCGLAYHANFLYVFGGTDIMTERTLFWRLDVSRVVLQNAFEVNVNWQALSLTSTLGPNHNILLRSGFSYVTIDGIVWLWGGEINIDQEVAEDYRSSFALNIRNLRLDVHTPSGDNPIPRIGHAAVRLGSEYCIHGGEDFRKRKLSDIWCFSSLYRNWTRANDGTVGGMLRISHAATNLGSDLLIHGGIDGTGNIQSEAWLYQFRTSTWVKLELGSAQKRLTAVYSHFITSHDDQIVIYGGATQRDSTSQLSTYRPGICNPAVSIPVSSARGVQILEDSSGNAFYPSGTQCRWEFKDSNHLLLNYTLGPKDRIIVSQRTSTGALSTIFTSSTSTSGSQTWISAATRGLVVALSSPDSLIAPAQGQFVKISHIACPLFAKVDQNSACYCEDGFYEDDTTNECKACTAGIKDAACPQPDESALDSGALGAVIGGTVGGFVLIGSLVYRRYASKMKAMADREQALFAKISYDELEFGQLLGVGSFGEVFIGNWRGSQVAVKKLNYSKMNKGALREFESEVSVMVQLRHPNVVLYMGAVVEPPNLCILSELMTRGSLHDILHNESIDLEYEQRLAFLIDAAKGLQYLHMCNPPMLHKDLKSPNLLLDDKWNLKISDFGLTGAKGTNVNDEPPGTLLWMAPEVIMAETYVEGSDIYSYSIIMWEVFTRFEPYQGELAESVAIRVAQEGFRPALPASDVMPEEVQNLMIRCWDQEPTKRPPFKDVLRELNTINGTYSATQSNSSSTRKGTGTMSSAKSKEAPPTGKVALVFTDVQSSTSMWEKYPEEMSEALVMHNELMRGVIRRNGGYEVKTEGDAFMITFKTVKKAVAYCLQAQETLLAAVWPDKLLEHPAAAMETSKGTIIFRGIRVRMGVHYGDPLCREDPITGRMDYFGPVVNRAARVGGFPKGGQVALSEPAYMEIVSELESLGNPVIRDLGEHMLKGLNVPDHLYEILPLGLADRSLYFMGDSGSGSSASVPNFVDQSGSTKTVTKDNFGWQVEYDEIQLTDQELGSGSFGIVYLGEFRNEKVAVKKFAKQKVGEKQYFELLAEIMLLRELDHPKILKFVGACLKPPNICMVMEYAQYGSLRSVLNDHQIKMTGTDQRSIMMQIADGMKFLNGRNPPIYHRDLKSPNILVGEINPFIVKLADFGLARVKADNQTMTKCGTKGWLAPEVLKGLRYNDKADVYSFGIMVWEVITRQKPYHGMDPLKLNFEVVSGLRPPVPKSGDAVLLDLMKQCWAGDPETRPSFAQIYDLLDNSLSSKTEK